MTPTRKCQNGFVDNMAAPSYDYQGLEGAANHPTQQIGRLFKFRNPHAPAEQLIGMALVIHTSGWYEFEVVAVQENGEGERELHDQRYILLINKEQLEGAVPVPRAVTTFTVAELFLTLCRFCSILS